MVQHSDQLVICSGCRVGIKTWMGWLAAQGAVEVVVQLMVLGTLVQ